MKWPYVGCSAVQINIDAYTQKQMLTLDVSNIVRSYLLTNQETYLRSGQGAEYHTFTQTRALLKKQDLSLHLLSSCLVDKVPAIMLTTLRQMP